MAEYLLCTAEYLLCTENGDEEDGICVCDSACMAEYLLCNAEYLLY